MPLTPRQLRELRAAVIPVSGNRVQVAMEMLDLTQATVADGVGLTQPYVSDVSRGRHATITLDNARRFAAFFGCQIEDLFPAREGVA